MIQLNTGGGAKGLGTPDFDSGFLSIAQGQLLTIPHGLSGSIENFYVQIDQNNTILKTMDGVWKFDEISGTTVADSSGNGFDLTTFGVVKPSFQAGLIGNSIEMNDTGALDEFAARGNGTDLDVDNTDSFSIVVWIKPLEHPIAGLIVSKMYEVAPFTGWELFISPQGQLDFSLYSDFGALNYIRGISNKSIGQGDDEWNFIVCTYDGSRNYAGMRIYMAGREVDFIAINNPPQAGIGSISNAAEFTFGFRNAVTGVAPYRGEIDYSAFVKRVLTPTEIWYLYNFGSGRQRFLGEMLFGIHAINRNDSMNGTTMEYVDATNVNIRRSGLDPMTDEVRVRIWEL